jgi:hypothetical protein
MEGRAPRCSLSGELECASDVDCNWVPAILLLKPTSGATSETVPMFLALRNEIVMDEAWGNPWCQMER